MSSSVMGVGLASFFSDLGHETITVTLPAFLAGLGAGAGALGLIEGVSDGLASGAKLWGGDLADRLPRKKPLATAGYLITAVASLPLGFATDWLHVLAARSLGWIGRGLRTPPRNSLLVEAVPQEAYGRAFGFERTMDTAGAVVAPAAAVALLAWVDHRTVFLLTFVPGMLAALALVALVRESGRPSTSKASFAGRLGELPGGFRRFLLAVGVFGCADFAPSLLVLYAIQALSPRLGPTQAASLAAALYLIHNVLYAGVSYPSGALADRHPKRSVLATGYCLFAFMSFLLIFHPSGISALLLVFALAGMHKGVEEAAEGALAAELLPEKLRGTGFGLLAAVNGAGDLVSSLAVGLLWSQLGPEMAFGFSALLGLTGATLIARLR